MRKCGNMTREVLWTPQPMPVPGELLVKEEMRRHFAGQLYPEVLEDCVAKMEASEEKYGSPLMTKNGRSAYLDAYTDLLDTINYLVQVYEEEKDPDERAMITQDIRRLNRVAGSTRYQLEIRGILPHE